MSSHREAPEISQDPVADGTDTYAFVSPENPSKVILIANFIPLQKPDSGPNFYEFGDDVLYEIHVSNKGTAKSDIRYQFKFKTKIRNPNTFLYNTGQINNIGDESWNRPQSYTITKVVNGRSRVIARNLPCPPANVGVRSTPDYAKLTGQAIHNIETGKRVYAGPAADPFHVDLGSVFDLGALRPFQDLHRIPLAAMDGINSVQSFNVHTIALEVPIKEVTRGRTVPSDPGAPESVIGVWASASRRKGRVYNEEKGKYINNGPWVQVSRLANPLFNEVIVPMSRKDSWNASKPKDDREYEQLVKRPELQGLLPFLYPNVFPNLEAYDKDRADLHAILLTGIPSGVVPGFQNFTGPTPADMLRLNVAIPPKQPADQNSLGVVGGDLAGFPNGRRVGDDVVTIELRAIAGVTIPLVDPTYTPDGAAGVITDGTEDTNGTRPNRFPFVALANGGYQTKPGTSSP